MVIDEVAESIKDEILIKTQNLKILKHQKEMLENNKIENVDEEEIIQAKGFLAQKIALLYEIIDYLSYAKSNYNAFYDRADSNFAYYLHKVETLSSQLKEKEDDKYYIEMLENLLQKIENAHTIEN